MINVTKTYLPPIEEYISCLHKIWESGWVTNHGAMVQKLETELAEFLDVRHVQFVSNGTIALQIAIKALELKGEIITTPFSYVATVGTILWENCEPVFTDIEKKTFCIDADKIESVITKRTSAILATHVYGYPCDVDKIGGIAKKHNLKVIYDGAHAFGVKINNQSIFNFGDISTVSFHATKLFHTIEGGAVITQSGDLNKKISLFKSFGHIGEEYLSTGINGKNSEFHAAMGLCNLPYVASIIKKRKELSERYDTILSGVNLKFPEKPKNILYNFAYYPVIFEDENTLMRIKDILAENKIFTRRYFFPSLNKLPYLKNYQRCETAEDIASRVLCLPLYPQLTLEEADMIGRLIKHSM